MKKIRTPMFRYGIADFDCDYIKWGFHDKDTQLIEAKSILKILDANKPIRILDLACGIGTHAIYWAKQGHKVIGVDLSEKFISVAKEAMRYEDVYVDFIFSDIKKFEYKENFDLVVWIERSFFDQDIVEKVYEFLYEGGYFIFDVRNPENQKTKSLGNNSRTWKEENEIFYLERHEVNKETGEWEDEWITIDTKNNIIEEKYGGGKRKTLAEEIEILRNVGFNNISFKTMEAEDFIQGECPYWLWIVANK